MRESFRFLLCKESIIFGLEERGALGAKHEDNYALVWSACLICNDDSSWPEYIV